MLGVLPAAWLQSTRVVPHEVWARRRAFPGERDISGWNETQAGRIKLSHSPGGGIVTGFELAPASGFSAVRTDKDLQVWVVIARKPARLWAWLPAIDPVWSASWQVAVDRDDEWVRAIVEHR